MYALDIQSGQRSGRGGGGDNTPLSPVDLQKIVSNRAKSAKQYWKQDRDISKHGRNSKWINDVLGGSVAPAEAFGHRS